MLLQSCRPPDARSCRQPAQLPEQISLHEARETARLTLPKSPPRNTGHTLAEAAYLHLSQHAQAVAARTGVSPDERDLLAEKIPRDLSDDAVRQFGFPVMTKAAIRRLHDIIGSRTALEVGAGPALISAELQAMGSRIRATDRTRPASPPTTATASTRPSPTSSHSML